MSSDAMMGTLRKGYSPINALYCKQLLAKFVAMSSQQSAVSNRQSAIGSQQLEPNKVRDEVLNKMLRVKYSLRSRIRATSNKFHDCKNDAQRAEVCDELDALEAEYQEIKEDIAYYDRHRMIRPKVTDTEGSDFMKAPENPIELMQAIQSARSSLSIAEKEIEELGEAVMYDKTHFNHKKWQRLEERRKKWAQKLKILLNAKDGQNI